MSNATLAMYHSQEWTYRKCFLVVTHVMNNPLPRFRFVLESFRNIFLVECIEAKLNNPYGKQHNILRRKNVSTDIFQTSLLIKSNQFHLR